MPITDYYIFEPTDSKVAADVDEHVDRGDEDGLVARELDQLRQSIAKDGFSDDSDKSMKKLVTRLIYKQREYGSVPKKRLPRRAIAMGQTMLIVCDK